MDNVKKYSLLPPVEKTGRGSLLNRPSCPPMTQSVEGLNCNELV